MPRRTFSAGTVTNTTGAPLRLTFHATSTTGRRETDLWTVDGSSNPAERIPNGVILTDASGAYSAFAGPDDCDLLWLQVGSSSASRTQLTASGTVAGGTTVDSATYVRIGRPVKPGVFTGLTAALETGSASVGLQVLTDSTGAGTTRWPYLLSQSLATAYPAYSVIFVPWNPSNQNYDAPTVIQTGPLGQAYVQIAATSPVSAQHPGDGTDLTGGIMDIRADVQPTTWTPASAQTIVSRCGDGTTTKRQFRFQLNTNGQLLFDVSTDGAALSGQVSSGVAVPFTAGARGQVRVTYNPATGAVQFYTSSTNGFTTLGSNWATLGTSKTSTVGPLYNPVGTNYEAGARTNSAEPLTNAKVFGVEVYAGSNTQPSVVDNLITNWQPPAQANYITRGGSPTLAIVNGSQSGAALTDLSARVTKMCPPFSQAAVLMATSKNDTLSVQASYFTSWASWLSAVQARLPLAAVGVTSQNPSVSPAPFIYEHDVRRGLIAQFAAQKAVGFIDVYRAFTESSLGLASLTNVDGIHPSDATGSPLWRDAVLAALTGRG